MRGFFCCCRTVKLFKDQGTRYTRRICLSITWDLMTKVITRVDLHTMRTESTIMWQPPCRWLLKVSWDLQHNQTLEQRWHWVPCPRPSALLVLITGTFADCPSQVLEIWRETADPKPHLCLFLTFFFPRWSHLNANGMHCLEWLFNCPFVTVPRLFISPNHYTLKPSCQRALCLHKTHPHCQSVPSLSDLRSIPHLSTVLHGGYAALCEEYWQESSQHLSWAGASFFPNTFDP